MAADDLIVNAPPDLQYKAQLMEALYNDPKTRPQFLQLHLNQFHQLRPQYLNRQEHPPLFL